MALKNLDFTSDLSDIHRAFDNLKAAILIAAIDEGELTPAEGIAILSGKTWDELTEVVV